MFVVGVVVEVAVTDVVGLVVKVVVWVVDGGVVVGLVVGVVVRFVDGVIVDIIGVVAFAVNYECKIYKIYLLESL